MGQETNMRLALISDIHANRQALQACLAHARQQGFDQLAFLGDLVGYGGEPVAVLDQVMDLAAQGAWVLKGNHDEMALHPPTAEGSEATQGAQGAPWTHAQLSTEHKTFLSDLPLTVQRETLLLVHASADKPEAWRYVDSERAAGHCLDAAMAQGASHVLVGHVHHQTLYYQGAGRLLMRFEPKPGLAVPVSAHRPLVACVGSCGQPRDGDPRAMYTVYDRAARKLTFHRVPYNHTEAAQAIRLAQLPEFFAQRLERGR
jgi:diadenosine tetraphosphatase ApaH/serine/threonine PP2A family protein phosphatase